MNATAQKPETLADLRNAAGKTTRQTGEALGLTQPRITQIEQKGTANIDHLQALADFYGVSFDRIRAAATVTRSLSN